MDIGNQGDFHAVYGVYYIEGNQEARTGNFEKKFEGSDIHILQDQTIYLTNGVQLVGLRDSMNSDKLPLESVLLGLDSEKPVITVSHRPVSLNELSDLGSDLTLCGHTIGGQYPFGSLFVRATGDMVYGQKTFQTMQAITTSGAGGYGIPAKFTSKSEIVIINVTFTGE